MRLYQLCVVFEPWFLMYNYFWRLSWPLLALYRGRQDLLCVFVIISEQCPANMGCMSLSLQNLSHQHLKSAIQKL